MVDEEDFTAGLMEDETEGLETETETDEDPDDLMNETFAFGRGRFFTEGANDS
jgi:hypothetical protein